jgi:hypothetical protein
MLKFVLLLVLWIAFGVFTSNVARQKGRDPFIWFFIGCLFGWIGLILVFVLPRVEKSKEAPKWQSESNTAASKGEVIEVTPLLLKPTQRLWFFLNKENEQQGPVPFTKLKELWAESVIKKETLVWAEGMTDWTAVAASEDLFPLLQNS